MAQLVDSKSANPGPLGLFAFGVTTLVLSSINAGLIPHESIPAVVPLAFAFGGVAQIIAGILEFVQGNTFGMVAFTSYGLFWWWFALLQWTIGAGWLKAPPPAAGGTVLLCWGLFTLALWIVTLRLNKVLFSVFLLLTITFFLLAAGDFGMGTAKLGGYLGLLTGLDAILLGFFELLNTVAGRTVIPLGSPLLHD